MCESCANSEHVCSSEAVDEHVPSLGGLLTNERLVCSWSLSRVCLGGVSGVCRVCVGGVCRGHSEELSTIKQSGPNVKPSDLLSNPCLSELCSQLVSGQWRRGAACVQLHRRGRRELFRSL